MSLRQTFFPLFLLLFSFSIISCDSDPEGEGDSLVSNSFKAVVEGQQVEKHELLGSIAIQGQDWSGSAHLFDIGDRFGDSDEDLVYFGLTLSPEGNSFTNHEAINLTYVGETLTAGTYDIVEFDKDGDRDKDDFEKGVFRADYLKVDGFNREDTTRANINFEMYPGSLGSVTLTEVTEDNVVGSFDFHADVCRCFNFKDLLDRLMDGIDRDGSGDKGNPFEDLEKEMEFDAEGEFNVDLNTSRDFDFNKNDGRPGVRISKKSGR